MKIVSDVAIVSATFIPPKTINKPCKTANYRVEEGVHEVNTLNTKVVRGYLFVVPQRPLISEVKTRHEYHRD